MVSPLMGFLTDNFGTTWLGKRFGRRKFFILLGIPCVFSYSAMWVGEMGFWYYLATYLLFDMVYTMILVPYETLVPEMTDDFKQKTKFSGARISMAQMSAILASFLPGILLSWLGKDNASSFFYASLVFSVLCAVMLTLVWCFTWERPREAWSEAALRAEAEKQNLTLAQSLNRLVIELSSTLRIKIFRQHLGMYLGGYIAQDVFNAVFTYYVVFVLMQEAAVASNLLGTMAIFQFIVSNRHDPAVHSFWPRAVVPHGGGPVWPELTLLRAALLRRTERRLFLIAAHLCCRRTGTRRDKLRTVEYLHLYCRRRRSDHRPAPGGDFAGIMTLTRKASQAGAVMLVGIIMQLSGFVSGQKIQPEGVSHTILLILSVGTLVVLACGFLVSLRFKLNLHTHSVLRSETLRMRELGYAQSEQTSAEHRAVVELLAGMPYDCLWGNNNIGYLNRHKPAAPALIKGGALNSTYTRG